MKIIIPFMAGLFFVAGSIHAQTLNTLKKKADGMVKNSSNKSDLGNEEISAGLKEALTLGVKLGVNQLSKPGGYLNNPEVRISLPDEAQIVETTLRNMGQDKLVDEALTSLNRAAEDAVDEAKNIFVKAIKDMSVQDAAGILGGEEDAATQYLDKMTRLELEEKFRPIIAESLNKVNATTYWNTLFSTYNKLPFVGDVNPDIEEYTTDKAIDGLFVQIAKEEKAIRMNPEERITDTLKKVFGS